MASIIVIETAASEAFKEEAASLLREHDFKEVSDGTFVGDGPAEPLVAQLKSLESYSAWIELHHGFVSKA